MVYTGERPSPVTRAEGSRGVMKSAADSKGGVGGSGYTERGG